MFKDADVTKQEVADYYIKVAQKMLRYAGGRTLSRVVCPDGAVGAGGECFYQKNPVTFLSCADDLIAHVQNNTIEFHVWGCQHLNPEKPDMMVFDLDPDVGLGLKAVRQGARDLKEILDALGLTAFLKTSGNKGYHIVIPFYPSADWETFNTFAKRVAQLMEQKWPMRYTANVRKINRKDRIFVDWIRNGRGATSIAPYSIRAKVQPRVSMPITWQELDVIAPNSVTMAGALRRLKKPDPWAQFFRVQKKQVLKNV